MRVGIYKVNSGRSAEYLDIYRKILMHNKIHCEFLTYDEFFFGRVKELDYYIHRFIGTDYDMYIARSILPVIEKELKIPCYPNTRTHWSYEDKIREYFVMQANGFPMAKSHILFTKEEALQWISDCELPLVFKLRSGAGSSNVVMVRKRSAARKLIKRMFGKGMTDTGIPGFANLKFYNLKTLLKHTGIKFLTSIGAYKS